MNKQKGQLRSQLLPRVGAILQGFEGHQKLSATRQIKTPMFVCSFRQRGPFLETNIKKTKMDWSWVLCVFGGCFFGQQKQLANRWALSATSLLKCLVLFQRGTFVASQFFLTPLQKGLRFLKNLGGDLSLNNLQRPKLATKNKEKQLAAKTKTPSNVWQSAPRLGPNSKASTMFSHQKGRN